MKKIIAIMMDECAVASQSALEQIGIQRIAFLRVLFQRPKNPAEGLSRFSEIRHIPVHSRLKRRTVPVPGSGGSQSAALAEPGTGHDFLPGTMLMMAVTEQEVLPVIRTLIRVNRNRNAAGGRIFICPLVTIAGINDPGISRSGRCCGSAK